MFRPLIAAAILALPLPALAQSNAASVPAAPQMAAAVLPAWSFAGAAAVTQPQPRIIIRERDRLQKSAEALPVREKAEWRDTDGFRVAGAKVAYRRRF